MCAMNIYAHSVETNMPTAEIKKRFNQMRAIKENAPIDNNINGGLQAPLEQDTVSFKGAKKIDKEVMQKLTPASIKALVLGLMATFGASTMTSCTEDFWFDEDEIPGPTINQNFSTEVNVTINSINNNPNLTDEQIVAMLKPVLDRLDIIIANQEISKDNFQNLINIVTSLNITGDRMYEILLQLGLKQDQIINLITQISNGNDDMREDLATIVNNTETMKQYLAQILALAGSINGTVNEIQNIQLIIQNWVEIIANNSQNPGIIPAGLMDKINDILGKMQEIINNQNTAHQDRENIINVISSNMEAITRILNNIHLSGQERNDLLAESNRLAEIQNQILNRMDNNLAEFFQETWNRFDSMADAERAFHLQILQYAADGNASLDEIKDLLRAGNDINLGNSGNLELIRVAIQGLRNDFNNLSPEILSKLNAILNKIPAGCNCNCDTAEIIAKLEIIITKLESGNHEGILDDLDNLNSALN